MEEEVEVELVEVDQAVQEQAAVIDQSEKLS